MNKADEVTTDINHVKDAVRETMTDQFKSVKVRDIKVNDDTDQFGDDVLRIDVVFDGHSLNPRGMSSFVRLLRPRLLELQELKFPVVSFISSAEK